MGLKLKSPLIIGSSGLSGSTESIKKIPAEGVGAIVLKSIFEEQIRIETEKMLKDKKNVKLQPMLTGYDEIISNRPYDYSEALDYMSNFAKEQTLGNYLKFISMVKKALNIPVIPSINCTSAYDWHYFARRIQEAGADALELNIYILPSDFHHTTLQVEKIYTEIIEAVKSQITIPFALKIGYYFTDLASKIVELSKAGPSALVLFNRPYSPDIDIDTFEFTGGNVFSSPADYVQTLRWIGIVSGRVNCDLSAASGVHNAQTFIKMLLAGAKTVQITSALFQDGFEKIPEIISGLQAWMEKHNFKSIDDFRGKMNQANIANPADYERVQFMKLYSGIV